MIEKLIYTPFIYIFNRKQRQIHLGLILIPAAEPLAWVGLKGKKNLKPLTYEKLPEKENSIGSCVL